MSRTSSAGTVVVTGVSSGIGRATAEVLLERGYRVFGSVRTNDDADRLGGELGDGFMPLVFDVTDAPAIAKAASVVAEDLGDARLFGLVNSAGLAVAGPLLYQSEAEFARHLDVNVTGPFRVTQAFAPLLGADRARRGAPGRIVVISSISGQLATPFLGAYAASKHAVEGYADSLRRELIVFGIDVVIVAPGAVSTPIWDKADREDAGAYAPTPYASAFAQVRAYMIANGRKGLAPEAIAGVVANALVAKRPKAYQPVLRGRFANWTVPRSMPRRVLDRVMASKTGLKPS